MVTIPHIIPCHSNYDVATQIIDVIAGEESPLQIEEYHSN